VSGEGAGSTLEGVARRTRIGLVAAGDSTAQIVKLLLRQAGYVIEPLLQPAQLPAYWTRAQPHPDLWLLDSREADSDDLLAALIEHSDAPFLVNDQAAPLAQPLALARWRHQLLDKVDEMAAALAASSEAGLAPAQVWVLAASTGGPAAVRDFLAALPAGLPLALVYVQHIDSGFDATLLQGLARSHYPARLCRGEQRLQRGRLLLVPADRQLRFLPQHRVMETRRPWDGRYRPAIDAVVAPLARLYQNRCGVIIFSGLGDDGAIGCRLARASGARVWVQAPVSCISPAMPEAALATGAVSFTGSPLDLASALAAQCRPSTPTQRAMR
jgi:chemosensory pili system protein ChpB (putative protein-glutamate methylesterase)